MGAYTPFLNLYQPGGGSTGTNLPDESADIDLINSDLDLIDTFAATTDARLDALEVPAGTLPVSGGGTGATTAGQALTNLGVSAFAKTLLDDAAASNARTTLGAGTKGGAIFIAADLAAARSAMEISYGTAAPNNGDGKPDGHIYIQYS